jgi:hypothetical protein
MFLLFFQTDVNQQHLAERKKGKEHRPRMQRKDENGAKIQSTDSGGKNQEFSFGAKIQGWILQNSSSAENLTY